MNQALSPELQKATEQWRQSTQAEPVPTHHLWQRSLLAFLAALSLSLCTLALIHQLISQPQAIASKDYDYNVIDFVRLKKDSDIETRNRKLPEKPEPPEELPAKTLNISQTQSLSPQDLEFELPPMDLPKNLSSGPELSGLFSQGTGGQNRSIIPLVRIQPQYPRKAVMRQIEGEVLLAFTITPTGSVANIEVISAKPKGVFERAAKRALLKWRFKPKVVQGKAISQQAQQNFVFKLNNP